MSAPAIAVSVKRCRALMMSGRLRSALTRVPATKPSWTDKVSQLAVASLRCHSLVSAGTTAEPLNQSDIPSNSAIASTASVRQREIGAWSDEDRPKFCKREIVQVRLIRLRANDALDTRHVVTSCDTLLTQGSRHFETFTVWLT